MQLSRSRFYYREHQRDDSQIEQELLRQAQTDVSAGFWKMQKTIRKKQLQWNHKREHRVYSKLKAQHSPQSQTQATGPRTAAIATTG